MFEIVSAVVINRNRSYDLAECLESIKNQTYPTIEIMVVDNASTDNPQHVNIRMPYNMGVTIPTNIGVASSIGKYILLVDNDAILEKEFVENGLYIMNSNPDIGVVAARIYKYGTGMDWDFESYGLNTSPSDEQEMGTFCGTACLIRRDIWDKVGGYNKDYFAYYQEPDIAARIMKAGYRILYYPKCKAWHKFASGSRDNRVMLFYLTRNHFLFVWEHLPFWLALFQSVKWVGWSVMRGWRHPFALLRAYVSVVGAIYYPLSRRKALRDPIFTQHWKKWRRR